jgi:hypothetical protein
MDCIYSGSNPVKGNQFPSRVLVRRTFARPLLPNQVLEGATRAKLRDNGAVEARLAVQR